MTDAPGHATPPVPPVPPVPGRPVARSRRRRPWRRRDALHVHGLHSGPNMTPMVDVVLVILIFFMASTVILGPEFFLRTALADDARTEQGADLSLPPAEFLLRLEPEPEGVRLTGLGLQSAPLASARPAFAALAQSLGPDATERLVILIDPADGVPYQDVVTVHEAAQRAGFRNVGLR